MSNNMYLEILYAFSFPIHPSDYPTTGEIGKGGETRGACGSLPAIWRSRDLALLILLITVFVSDIPGMQFAGSAIFFYWFLALLTFQLPSICVFSWLMHQAPRRVPIAVWLFHFVQDRWPPVS